MFFHSVLIPLRTQADKCRSAGGVKTYFFCVYIVEPLLLSTASSRPLSLSSVLLGGLIQPSQSDLSIPSPTCLCAPHSPFTKRRRTRYHARCKHIVDSTTQSLRPPSCFVVSDFWTLLYMTVIINICPLSH